MGRILAISLVAACAPPARTDPQAFAPVAITRVLTAGDPTLAATDPAATATTPTAEPDAPPSCIGTGTPFAAPLLRAQIEHLASPELEGRVAGSKGDLAARTFITQRFRCLGLLPGGAGATFEQPFRTGRQDTANLIGYVAGTDPRVRAEIILVGAHHDHLGDGHFGANDNASGVVALLAIAQAIQQRATGPRRTIAFVAFGAEELGMQGSRHFVAHPSAALPIPRIVQMVNLDMVGTHASRGFVAAMGTFRGLAATRHLAALDDGYPALHVGLGGVARGSDHEPFCARGIPYVFFWTPDARCYHATCDTADHLDYPRMIDIASLAGSLVARLADTDDDLAALQRRRGCGDHRR